MIRRLHFFVARWFHSFKFTVIYLLVIFLGGMFCARMVIGNRSVLPPLNLVNSSVSYGQLSNIFTPEVLRWSPLIHSWASTYNVDPNLIATVIQIESCGDPTAISRSGAQGLFQVMPFHFIEGEDMLEVMTNARRGMDYLAKGLKVANGDAGLALAGYNGGHGVIRRDPSRWPAETQRYYRWGTGIYGDAAKGLTSSQTMQEWFNAGGRSMCKKAATIRLQNIPG
jgi:hypothetical protein